jgi:predicted amidohydrolase YtcJ
MWAAVNRRTVSGRVLGEYETISPAVALQATTLGAAYLLHLDHLIGSLETGKFADMTVLAEDPLAVDSSTIRDIEVRDTIVGGDITSELS